MSIQEVDLQAKYMLVHILIGSQAGCDFVHGRGIFIAVFVIRVVKTGCGFSGW